MATHGAVDEEVEGVAEEDEEVDDESGKLPVLGTHELMRGNVLVVEREEEEGQRTLHRQEDAHHNHQHQRRHVRLRQST